MKWDQNRTHIPTPAGTLEAIPLALEAMGGDLEQIAGEIRTVLDRDIAEMGPSASFCVRRLIDRVETQAKAAKGIAKRAREIASALIPPQSQGTRS